jgi:hypothetical protein
MDFVKGRIFEDVLLASLPPEERKQWLVLVSAYSALRFYACCE